MTNFFKKINEGISYKEFKYKNTYLIINVKNNIDWSIVLQSFKKIDKYLSHINYIYYGENEELKADKNLSLYKAGSIYVSNDVSNVNDVLKCIIHECIHSFVNSFEQIKGFKEARNEYLQKKRYILNLTDGGEEFAETFYYNSNFDKYLLNIGYDKLNRIIPDKFPSAYSITSFIEYVAVCAEEFFFEDDLIIQNMCPYVVKYIQNIGG